MIDPDALTRDLMADYPAWAAREALRRRQAALAAGRTLAVETTLAGSGVLRFMEVARQDGHRIVLHDVSVSTAEQALLYDNTDPAVPHREVAMLRAGEWWSAERLPIWAAAAIARVSAPNS